MPVEGSLGLDGDSADIHGGECRLALWLVVGDGDGQAVVRDSELMCPRHTVCGDDKLTAGGIDKDSGSGTGKVVAVFVCGEQRVEVQTNLFGRDWRG